MKIKNFDEWNEEKKKIDAKRSTSFPSNGEIWICKLGLNIGREQNGGRKDFSRPVLVVYKFNNEMFWVVPLSTKQKDLDFYHNFTDLTKNKVSVILAQMKLVSINRFERMLYKMEKCEFEKVITKLQNFLNLKKSKPRTRRGISGSHK